ncbi:MAG: efflux RND transporter periplasmic adaptor subunit [Calditrichaceae bacterium]
MKYFVISITITLTILLLVFCSRHDNDTESPEVETPVKTVLSKMRTIHRPVRTSGLLAPVSQIKLSFKTGGIIDLIPVDEGDPVNKGQLIARLQLNEIEAKYNQAKSAYEKAKRDFRRVKQLYADSVATIEQYQNTQTALDMAKAALEVAEFNYRHSFIKAPADGSILYRLAEEDELVGPGQPVIVFGTTGKKWLVRAGVTEKDLLRLQLGDTANVSFDAYPDKKFSATVNQIAEAATQTNGTFEVELLLEDKTLPLKSGFVAKIEIIPSTGRKYITIPVESLVDADENSAYVFSPTASKDSVLKLPVSIAFIYQDLAVIDSGLGQNVEIITSGSNYLNEDSRINIRN